MGKINELKSGFGNLATDKPVEVEIEGSTLELDMRVEDLHPIMVIGQKEQVGDADIERLTAALRRVVYRSYLPYWDAAADEEMKNLSNSQEEENEEAKQYVENLLLKHYMELFEGIMSDLGWADDTRPTLSDEENFR